MTDSDLYRELYSLLQDLDGAERVLFGSAEPITEQDYPAVVLSPVGWEELDKVDPNDPERVCRFEIRAIASGAGGFEQFECLDQLVTAICETVRGNDLAGQAISALSLIDRGKVERKYPVEAHVLSGSFSYLPHEGG